MSKHEGQAQEKIELTKRVAASWENIITTGIRLLGTGPTDTPLRAGNAKPTTEYVMHSTPAQGRAGRARYQTVCTLEARMRPSRLMTGTPKYNAVAATILSGMSGMSTRSTWRMVSTTPPVNGAS